MTSDQPDFDTTQHFVRVRQQRPDGFVEFEFSVGEPEIFVELILGAEAFAEFCTANAVTQLPPRESDEPTSDWDWRMSDATATRFK